MRVVLQRVTRAAVTVSDEVVGSIGRGLCVLVGIHRDDTEEDMKYIIRKILNLIGNKLDFHTAMAPTEASKFYASFSESLKKAYKPEKIQDGKFAAMMSVDIVNDGPVTISFDKGPKKQYIEELERQVGKEFQTHLDKLKAVPFESKASSTALAYKAENKRRKDWIIHKKLPLNESSFLLYLVDRAKGIGSCALSKISAAYQAANQGISTIGATFVADVIKSKRREEVQCKKAVIEVTLQDVEKITKLAMDEITPARDRDALLAIFSFHVMLRASEAAEIKWEGVTQKDGMIEVHVEKAKNDQLRLGRSSFFNYKPGSDADILMCRWRIHSGGKSPYVFANLDGSGRLRSSSISALATKMLTAIGKSGATHHAFRRGGANHMRRIGHSMEEIQARGRWRSMAGLQRYIKDVPIAQGCVHPQENEIAVEEDDDDFE